MPDDDAALKRFRAGVFDRAADTYDRVGEPHFAHLGRRLVELAGPREGQAALDVGCGRGAVLLPAAEAVGPSGRAVGTDLSPRMVEAVREEARERSLESVEALVADAEDLGALDSDSFDLAFCAFSLFFFPAPERALAELRRVLRPGGVAGVSTWGKFDRNRFGWYGALLKRFEVRVRMMSAPFDEPDQLRDALVEAGFEEVEITTERVTRRTETPEEWWDALLSAGSRAHVEALESDDRERFREAAFEHLLEADPAGAFEDEVDAFLAIARSP